MLKADIALSDLAHDVVLQNGVVHVGESHITPHFHAALEALFVRTDGQWFLVVRERLAGKEAWTGIMQEVVDVARFDQLYRECLLWPLDYVMVEVALAGKRLKIQSGAFGVAPLYCRAESDRLRLSWDLTDFLVETMALDAEVASHCLVLDNYYSSRQACVGIMMLTERASLYVEPGSAYYRYPKEIELRESLVLDGNVSALEVFSDLLQKAISKRPVTSARAVVQLSGGMDSAAVAGSMAACYGHLESRGILLDGVGREAQIARRQQIADRLGLIDQTVEMRDHPPSLDLVSAGRGKEFFLKEFYLEAFDALWGTARARGCEWLFTGVGGDELFLPRGNETHAGERDVYAEVRHHAEGLLTSRGLSAARSLCGFNAPAAPIPVSSLLAQACHAPHLLKRGLWPVNPLCDPSLVRFCHLLPPEHRQDRELLRRFLQRCFGEKVFPLGYIKETFVRVLPELIAKNAHVIAAQLENCALADFGLVDRNAVLNMLERVRVTQSAILAAPLANFLWLERFVRQIA